MPHERLFAENSININMDCLNVSEIDNNSYR